MGGVIQIFTDGWCDTKTTHNSSLMSEWAIEKMGEVDNIENNRDEPVQILIYIPDDLHNFVMGNFLRKEQHRVFMIVNCAFFFLIIWLVMLMLNNTIVSIIFLCFNKSPAVQRKER